jgi:hypothetical protein
VITVTFPYDPDRQWFRLMLAFLRFALSTDRTGFPVNTQPVLPLGAAQNGYRKHFRSGYC